MTRDELDLRLHDLSEELRNLRLRSSLKQEGNPLRIRYLRRTIARIKTLLHEDERGIRHLARGEQESR
ncbi:MAG: 50S ribosomal protein L29 [Candidatus Eisenbacteria bacterium]|nr:50S ribosomal protein L29 [Candidatus Eisenbacteria bacterium]